MFLQNNRISDIHPNAFKNLFRLEILHLENNRLGDLDPSGLTFQHLSKLQTLSIQNNNIRSINKYSFFTVVAPGKKVSVNLDQNPIQCDCNVWALRSWVQSLPGSLIEINLQCENDDQKRSYEEVEISKFGDCTIHDSVYKIATCPSCDAESTNHGCNLNSIEHCSEQMVCHKTVNWNHYNKIMLITSQCENYKSCLMKEANNWKTCGTDFQTNKNVDCHFCCLGPTCMHNSIGARTKDLTLDISHNMSVDLAVNVNAATVIDPKYLNPVPRYLLGNVQGGAFGISLKLNPLYSRLHSPMTSRSQFGINAPKIPLNEILLEVSMELVLTVFSTEMAEESIKKTINDNIPLVASHLFSPMNDSIRCPESVSYSLDKGKITWEASVLGSQREPCPYNNQLFLEQNYAFRECIMKDDKSVDWGDVDYSFCANKNKEESETEEKTFNAPLLPDCEQTVSASLKANTENHYNLTKDTVDEMLNLLELLSNEIKMVESDVVGNILDSVSNLININQSILLENSISERLLTVIDDISEKAPLTEGKLVVVTPNLAIAAQEVNTSETEDVVFTVDGYNGSLVSVGFYKGNTSQLTGRTSIVIPMKAIIATMTTSKKDVMNRVSFAVHQSDKLFIAMEENGETPQANKAQNYFSNRNNSKDCPPKNPHSFITRINSYIISASIPGVKVKELSRNITMNFVHNNANNANHRCVFWKKYTPNGTGGWSEEGCGIVVSYSGETTCACNHLTNFALLMDVYQEGSSLSEFDHKVLSIISYVGCGISFFTLLLTLLSYSVLRNSIADNPSKILINLCLALLLSNLVYLVGMHEYTFDNTILCKVMAVLLHYFLLSSMAWTAVEAFFLYLALVRVHKTHFTNFILKCSTIGWGVPLMIVVITLGISATENYGFINTGLCWLRNPAFYAAFVGPVCLILLVNCLVFGLVVKQLVSISSSKLSKTDKYSTIHNLRAAVGVVILLGLTWLFAIFAIGQASVAFYYLFAVFNSLQGLFIFIYYCLLKKDVLTMWKRLLPCFEESGEIIKSTSDSRAMTAIAHTHHLVKHDSHSKSDASTLHGNTVTTITSDSGKSFSIVNSYNSIDDREECVPTH